MKALVLLGMALAQVLAVNYIQESIFNGHFALGNTTIVAESADGGSGNVTRVSGNVTFVGRTISNTTIVDSYTIVAGDSTIGTATRTISVQGGFGFPAFGPAYLQSKFEIDLEEETPSGMLYQTDGSELKIVEIVLEFVDVSPESSVSEIYANDSGLTWKVYPNASLYPSYTTMVQGGLTEVEEPLFLHIFPVPAPKIELIFFGMIPCECGIINPYDPDFVLVPADTTTGTEDGPDEDDDAPVEDDEDEDEGIDTGDDNTDQTPTNDENDNDTADEDDEDDEGIEDDEGDDGEDDDVTPPPEAQILPLYRGTSYKRPTASALLS
ncbi:hypothetical protein NEOKW01_1997 [Nematocida sp. AWRm80]|nr:hypothetical protein NEOKW01_1997 [Nematocida sp. AWRm80]